MILSPRRILSIHQCVPQVQFSLLSTAPLDTGLVEVCGELGRPVGGTADRTVIRRRDPCPPNPYTPKGPLTDSYPTPGHPHPITRCLAPSTHPPHFTARFPISLGPSPVLWHPRPGIGHHRGGVLPPRPRHPLRCAAHNAADSFLGGGAAGFSPDPFPGLWWDFTDPMPNFISPSRTFRLLPLPQFHILW